MELILAILATYGLSILITAMDGPFVVFAKLRQADRSGITQCVICTSFWVALLTALLISDGFIDWVIAVFALVGAVIILNLWSEQYGK